MNIGNASKNNHLVKFTLTSETDMEDAMTSFFFKMQRLEEIFGQNIKISDLRTMFFSRTLHLSKQHSRTKAER